MFGSLLETEGSQVLQVETRPTAEWQDPSPVPCMAARKQSGPDLSLEEPKRASAGNTGLRAESPYISAATHLTLPYCPDGLPDASCSPGPGGCHGLIFLTSSPESLFLWFSRTLFPNVGTSLEALSVP